jgi:hypothetical protein
MAVGGRVSPVEALRDSGDLSLAGVMLATASPSGAREREVRERSRV